MVYYYIVITIISIIMIATLLLLLTIETTIITLEAPPKSLDVRGFDSSRLLILRGGNYHIHRI